MRRLVLIWFVLGLAGSALGACPCFISPFSKPNSRGTCNEGQNGFNYWNERCTCRRGKLIDCYRVRRDFTSMPWSERLRFNRALLTISSQQPHKRTYDRLISTHTEKFATGIHKTAQFLPWHRMYLLQMENLLQKVDRRVTMPYWDWSLFSGQPWRRGFNDVFSGSPWSLGGNGGRSQCVVNGPFRPGRWKTTPSNRQGCLKRNFNGNPPDVVAVHEVNLIPGNQFTKFEVALRDTLHNNMHCRIGGRGGTMCSRASANAPEFLLHHGFTDKLWADWQKMGDKKGDRSTRDQFFKRREVKLTSMSGFSRDLVDLSRQPGGVKVMYADPSHDEYRKIHGYLAQLTLAELKTIPRKRFTKSGTLEFKTFMVSSRSERAQVNAQQNAMEPAHSLSSRALHTSTDRAMGVRVTDIETAVKRKRSLELRKKQARDQHVIA